MNSQGDGEYRVPRAFFTQTGEHPKSASSHQNPSSISACTFRWLCTTYCQTLLLVFNMRITSEEDECPRFELFILGDDEKKVEWKDETRKPTLLCTSLTFIPTHLVPKAFRTPLPSSLIKKTTRSATCSRRASTNMTTSPSPHTKSHTRSSPSSKCAFLQMALSAPKTPSCARAEISCRIWRF